MQDNWIKGFDQFIQELTTGGSDMRQKDYYVKINYGGYMTYLVTAPDYEEAEILAQELFDGDCADLDDVEIYEITSEIDDD